MKVVNEIIEPGLYVYVSKNCAYVEITFLKKPILRLFLVIEQNTTIESIVISILNPQDIKHTKHELCDHSDHVNYPTSTIINSELLKTI